MPPAVSAPAPTTVLLHGEESFLVDEQAARLLRGWRAELVSDFGFEAVETSRLTPGALRDALMQAPFLDPYRIVAVRWIAPNRAEGLAAAFDQLPDTTRVVLTVNGRLGPGNRLARRIADLATGQVKEFPRLRARGLSDWAAERAREAGLPPSVAAAVVRVTPPDLGVIASELGKLAGYQATGGRLTGAVLDELLAGGREEDLFRLSDNVLPRPSAAAWRIARSLLDSGTSPTTIAYRLARHLSLVLEVRTRQERGEPLAAVQADMREHPFVVQKAYESAARVPAEDLERGLQTLLQYEWEVKSGQIDAEAGLEVALAKL
ncbi:MAG: DNA polymerase III subunit delta [Candidatus Dormibacteraceae bacterium]